MLLEHFFPPDIRVEKEARALVQGGHEVLLLSPVRQRGDIPEEEVLEGIRILRIAYPRAFLKRVWNFLQLKLFFIHPTWKKALVNTIKQYQIEALHVHDLPLINTGLYAAGKFNIPLVADLHENYPEAIKIWRRSWQARARNLISPPWRWKRLEKSCIHRADVVITVVEELRQHYIRDCDLPPDKIKLVMNLEDLEHFCSIRIDKAILKQYEKYFVVSYIGGFGHHRGIQTAIQAMPQVLKEIPNALLLLVGSGANEADLKELAKKAGVEQAVRFTGWQSLDLVPSYISASQICLVPYILSTQTNASAPHKLFQYMAMAKPVVVSSMDSLSRIIQETGAGLVYPAGNAEALAQAIIKLYKDDALRLKLGQAGAGAVQHKYNWQHAKKVLTELYDELEHNNGESSTDFRSLTTNNLNCSCKTMKEYFDREAQITEPVRAADEERATRITGMIPNDTSTILDVGCGNGLISNRIAPSKIVFGLDFSAATLLNVNKEKVAGNCAHLPFTDSSFDLVIASELLEHLEHPILNRTLGELQRVAKKYILISVPFEEKPWETFVKCYHCGYTYSPYGHQQYFDRERIKALFEASQKTIVFCGAKRNLPWFTWLGQKLLGVYHFRRNSICPRCNSSRLTYGHFVSLYKTIQLLLIKILAKTRPNWIICLYEIK